MAIQYGVVGFFLHKQQLIHLSVKGYVMKVLIDLLNKLADKYKFDGIDMKEFGEIITLLEGSSYILYEEEFNYELKIEEFIYNFT